MEFAQIFLHTGRLKLECTDGATLLIELVCHRVVDRNIIQIDVDTACLLHDFACFLLLGESL